MKNKLLLLTLLITFSCHKPEKVKNATPVRLNKTTLKDTIETVKNQPKRDSISCIDIVLDILTTSQSYVERTKGLNEAVIKNGGTSIGLIVEGSPNPKRDEALEYSETYVFSLHESYPDRMPTIARYIFDASKSELYESDIANDSLIPISFDKDLLVRYHMLCK